MADLGTGRVKHPFSQATEPKRRFVPSKWEAKAVVKLIRALRKGWIKPAAERAAAAAAAAAPPPAYLLWDAASDELGGRKTGAGLSRVAPPKTLAPGHAESYNPPPEYLPSEEEAAALREQAEYTGRPVFVPRRAACLRALPSYESFVRERFERCLDLYLCPRVARQRLMVDPASLLPQLPSPRELQPFPAACAAAFVPPPGESRPLTSASIDPSGAWLATGDDGGCVRMWEVATGRCAAALCLGAEQPQPHPPVKALAWCPRADAALLAACVGACVRLLDVGATCCGAPASDASPALASAAWWAAAPPGAAWHPPGELPGIADGSEAAWARCGGTTTCSAGGALRLKQPPSQLCWHWQGDYFATVAPGGGSGAVLVHQRSAGATQRLFNRNKGAVSSTAFHPSRPLLFVATQRHVYVYNLAKQALSKTLQAGCGPLTSLSLHPRGDNLLASSGDGRVCWFDLDLSARPYKTFASHAPGSGVAAASFHPRLPLFASAGTDGAAHVWHGRVYDDLGSLPLIVPLCVLRGHAAVRHAGVAALAWHPTQPWLVTAGADGVAKLWVNV